MSTLPCKLVKKYQSFPACQSNLQSLNVCNLQLGWDMCHANNSFLNSTSTCLVQSWWTGLWAILIADWLSHNSFIGVTLDSLSSSSKLFHQISSQVPCARALNSASALLLATKDCFLLLQVTRFPQTNVQYPEVDLLSSNEPAQSASVKTST